MPNWEPTADDIEWTIRTLSVIKDGGVWAVPASMSLFTLYKSRKEYGMTGDPMCETNQRIMKVLSKLGYKLLNNVN